MTSRDALRVAFEAMYLPMILATAALAASALDLPLPGIAARLSAGESTYLHHLRTCEHCNETDLDSRLERHLTCPELRQIDRNLARQVNTMLAQSHRLPPGSKTGS